jgi:hypothetical protein
MGMGQIRREEKASRFDGRVGGLDDLMGVRQIMPHKEVDIRRFLALVKIHNVSWK